MFRDARSLLYVPAHRPRMLARIGSIPADAFVVDLEDGVPPDAKATARDALEMAVAEHDWSDRRWALRINPLDSPWGPEDLELVARLAPPALVLPKVEMPGQLRDLTERLRPAETALLLMIETALGVGHARELASAHPGVAGLIYGSADLRRSLGAPAGAGREWERHAMAEILLAARMANCAAIDAVTFEFRDLARLASDTAVARGLGFDGKSCIHPDQLETIHQVFSSTADEIAWAEAVLEGWTAQRGDRAGVVVVNGEMIEALHLDIARRILARRP